MNELLDGLNTEQLEAVTAPDGPLLILAGAGSGKTKVLTHKIAYMLSERGVSPYNILAITFTNKAAAEMRERLSKLCRSDADIMWIKTFHSACLAILRRNPEYIGFKPGFNIYDDTDRKTLIKDCMKNLNIDSEKIPAKSCLSIISDAKNKMIYPENFLSAYGNDYLKSIYAPVYAAYTEALRANNAMDFDDLIMLTVKLFNENEEILRFYQNKFRYILVDEYQDTNHAQYSLISLLCRDNRNISVVGDDDQSIYKFRGADIRNILEFEKEFPDAKVIRLERNYRSTQNILDAANGVIGNNIGRKGKKLWTAEGKGEPVRIYKADNEYSEADFIAGKIDELKEKYSLSDIAVLFRTNNQSRALEERFRMAGIPHKLLSGLRFYDRKEVKDIMAYLKLIINPDDDIALFRCINEPKRGIGKTSLDNAVKIAAEKRISIYDTIVNYYHELGRSGPKMQEFAALIEELRSEMDTMPIGDFVERVIKKSGYYNFLTLTDDVESRSRLENLGELISGAKSFEAVSEGASISDYVDSISLVSDIDDYDEDEDSVSMMTIHMAKGLEFPVVFIAGCEDGLFPSERSKFEPDGIEEERRLAYVAITRARQELFMTWANQRKVFGKTEYHKESMFIDEIPDYCCEDITPKPTYDDFYYSSPAARKNAGGFEKVNFASFKSASADRKFDFAEGDRVRHKKFGDGTVAEAQAVGNDMRLKIIFDESGEKNLMAVYAKLEKISE